MKKIQIIILLFLTIGTGCYNKETLTREEVIKTIESFDAGWQGKKADMIDSVLSPSYIYFTQSGGTFSRANVIATAGSHDYLLDTVNRKKIDIQIDGNTAVANTTWRAKGMYLGVPFNDSQRCSITIIKNNGRVRILSEHCTPIK